MSEYILEKNSVTMDELCNQFGISINTARTDVADLVEKGVAKKIYGGVCSNQTSNLITFDKRASHMLNIKKLISKYAATLIEDGDVIFIDSGTTTMSIVDYLDDLNDVTIITHNLNTIIKAVHKQNLTIISLPGVFDRQTNSFADASTCKALEKYNIHKAFMGTASITKKGKATNNSFFEVQVKKAVLQHSEKKYLLVDSSKFGKLGLMSYCGIEEMDMIITNEIVDDEYNKLFEEAKTDIHIV